MKNLLLSLVLLSPVTIPLGFAASSYQALTNPEVQEQITTYDPRCPTRDRTGKCTSTGSPRG